MIPVLRGATTTVVEDAMRVRLVIADEAQIIYVSCLEGNMRWWHGCVEGVRWF